MSSLRLCSWWQTGLAYMTPPTTSERNFNRVRDIMAELLLIPVPAIFMLFAGTALGLLIARLFR
jgi:hypothetical protein